MMRSESCKTLEKLANGSAAMRDGILGIGIHRGECHACLRGYEHRVVAESGTAVAHGGDFTLYLSGKLLGALSGD